MAGIRDESSGVQTNLAVSLIRVKKLLPGGKKIGFRL
jgi:hypothetical protein